jgi:predicted TIM-barrel fold metal-dependent hydrolase
VQLPMVQSADTGQLGYAVVDADNHYYEPYDCFSRHLDPKYRDQTLRVAASDRGPGRMLIGGKPVAIRPNIHCDAVAPPGALKGALGNKAPTLEDAGMICPRDVPEFMNRDSRLELMDRQGLQAAILLPTTGVTVEHDLYKLGAEAALANLTAFNRWLEEDWGYAYQERIFAVPMLSLASLESATAELSRVLDRGARLVHLKAGPAFGRSPADPHFDPFWRMAEGADVPVVFHIGNAGYNEMICGLWGERTDSSLYEYTPLQIFLSVYRPIVDTLAALVLGNLFGRFPRLKILSIENGSGWIPSLLADMDHAAKTRPGELTDKPSDIFREHVYVAPFWEDNCVDAVDLIGAGHVLFGSDFPHPEGEAEPLDFLDSLQGLDGTATRKVMRDNTAALLKL